MIGHAATQPAGSSPTPVTVEQRVELLRKLQDAHAEQFRSAFQLFILSGVLPIFTLLAGYVFGKSAAGKKT